jgi:hypothetical protein
LSIGLTVQTKNTIYRASLSKIIPKIERDDGKTITKQFDILKETMIFYEELYKFRAGNRCKVSDLERV